MERRGEEGALISSGDWGFHDSLVYLKRTTQISSNISCFELTMMSYAALTNGGGVLRRGHQTDFQLSMNSAVWHGQAEMKTSSSEEHREGKFLLSSCWQP